MVATISRAPEAPVSTRPTRRRLLLRACCYALAVLVWLPLLRFVHEAPAGQVVALERHETRVLADPRARAKDNAQMRQMNPEWDLMRRMFLALSYADLALASPKEQAHYLALLDLLIDDLLQTLAQDEPYVFLLPYARGAAWKNGGRSLFVDGEVALVLEARLFLGPRRDIEAELKTRIEAIERAMGESPSVSGESYPDEAWTFCNTTALAALRIHDARMSTDHGPLARRWIAYAKANLREPRTGLLASRYRYDGHIDEGPEGSSIFMVAHNLLLWDEAFAREQYQRARDELTFDVLGFALAREWPKGTKTGTDVDSGPVVPILGASPGASGMALLGAMAFGDHDLARRLRRSMQLAAVPQAPQRGELSFAAAGPMGNAVVFHALTSGPLFGHVLQGTREVKP